MFTIKVKINLQKDAWNWWHACNHHSFGMSWRKSINIKMQKKLLGAGKKAAYQYLTPYLKKQYKKLKIESKVKPIEEIFNQKKDKIFQLMEKATGRKIFRKDFTLILTTLPRAPYHYPAGEVWLPIVWPDKFYVKVFLHELLHFQTYAYWRKRCLKKLSNEEFENLKEALTVILNDEFKSIMSGKDRGYIIHQYLRKELLKFWRQHKNFDKLVSYGVKIYPKYKDTIKYLQFGKYNTPCPKPLLNKIKKIKLIFGDKYIRKLFKIILSEFDPKKYKLTKTRSFEKSRFITVDKILKKHQETCGSLANIVASCLKSVGIPVKLVNGFLIKDGHKTQHAWNEIYFPQWKKFIAYDITRKDFKIGKYHIRKGEHVDWSELE